MSDKEHADRIFYIYIYTSGGRAWQAEVGSISREIAVQFGKRARAARFTRARHVRAAAAQCPRGETRSGGRLLTRKPTRHPSIRGCRNAAAIAPRVNTSRHPTFTSVASRCCNEPRPLRAEEPKDGGLESVIAELSAIYALQRESGGRGLIFLRFVFRRKRTVAGECGLVIRIERDWDYCKMDL